MLEALNNLDAQWLLAINGWHNNFFDTVMYAYSGKIIWAPMYAALLYVVVRNMGWRTALWCVLGIALTILFADQVCSHLIRPWVERWRPSRLENPLSEWVHIVNGYRGGRYGFPSCHAANTMGLACFFGLLIRHRWLSFAMFLWAFVTCYSRAYLGVHYPGDLLAGSLVGIVGACLMYRLFVKVSKYERPHEPRHVYVPVIVGALTVCGMFIYALF